ncbi:T9SS type A sorting domain-containing protein [bacterium]|nr:T9SS type A sorting domain-containing protein [bacterium]
MWNKIRSARGLSFILVALMVLAFSQVLAQGQGKRKRKIVIEPTSARFQIGSELQYSAKIIEVNGSETDTTFAWSVDATGFGTISEEGLFSATERGNGYVYAAAGDLTGKSHVSVVDTAKGDAAKSVFSHLEITPADTLILIGETLQFHASLIDSSGLGHDTTAVWELRGNEVGSLTEDGFFTATDKGVGMIRAAVGRYTATTRVLVSTEADTASQDTVRIQFRDRDGTLEGTCIRVDENDIFIINGLDFPLNVLNGGEIVFPAGSLVEGLSIDIRLTDAAIVENDSTVSYNDQILNGISFNVYVNDTLISPYYFTEPIQLVLPYKENLLNDLGLTADDLWIFFFENETDYNGDGISNVVVDTVMNKIYADVIHFSDLVIGSKALESTGVDASSPIIPDQHRLMANYPNPFNPETRIDFELGGQESVQAVLTVYNVLGQEIRTLLDALAAPGIHAVTWDGRNDQGEIVPSGLYFYKLRTGTSTLTRRMLLLK